MLSRVAAVLCSLIIAVVGSALLDHARADDTADKTRAPLFTLKDTQGNIVKLDDFAGKPVILSFVVTWDQPSLKQIEILSKIRSENSASNLVVLAAGIEQGDRPTTKAYVEQQHPKFPFLVADYETISAFGGLSAVPTTFVIDRDHNIVQKHVGITDKTIFEADLKLARAQ